MTEINVVVFLLFFFFFPFHWSFHSKLLYTGHTFRDHEFQPRGHGSGRAKIGPVKIAKF